MSSEFQFQGEPESSVRTGGVDQHRAGNSGTDPERGIRQNAMTRNQIHCETNHCGLPAVCSVELRFLCVGHFISYCYDRLEECAKLPPADFNETQADAVDRFLRECLQHAGDMVDPMRGLDNLERARLFDIFLWASELTAKRGVFAKPEILDTAYRVNRRGC